MRILIKVATEFNIGLQTAVEFLQKKGFELDSKPMAKISEEMYAELLKEFQGSIKEKEQANQLVKAPHSTAVKDKPKVEVNLFGDSTPAPDVVKSEPAGKTEEVITAKLDEDQKPKLKVVGKIDLDKPEPKKKTDKPEAEAAPPAESPDPAEEIVRIEAPTLKGLKILGKVDTNKLNPQTKKKEEASKPSPAGDASPSTTEADKGKRKRKRKKVNTYDYSSGGDKSANVKGKREEIVKEVSQKVIEEQIKATLARLSSGGKSKRQKLRRDKREIMREKEELREASIDRSTIQLSEFVTVSELSSLMNVPVTDVITTCMNMGIIVSINQRLDAEVIEFLAEEFGNKVEFIGAEELNEEVEEEVDDQKDLQPRAPIVTVMGHVDHGKTSLLDYIRKTNVASGEAGGITQHIGAYEVKVGPDQKSITFLDTPGHEAFTAMRARGAKVTDIAVIIIAADDHVMPQTKEAIAHAQAANVPMIFAINKVDKNGADPDRIKNELSQMNLLVEEWGGKYQSQEISAKTGLGVDALLEKILLEAELLNLKANPNRLASGTVIEALLDKGRGYIAKLLVQNGTLRVGDTILAGEHAGRIKAMFNERGQKLKEASPSTPVMVLGLTGAPAAGEKFKVWEDEAEARLTASRRAQINREQSTRAAKRISLDEVGRRLALGNFKELKLIVKGDVDGSIEALTDSLIKLSVEKIQVSVIHKAVGQIVESDVLLASASDAIIIGFQVRPSPGARALAEKEGVQIKLYSIIYEAIDEIRAAMEGMLEPTKEEKIVAQAEVREVFKISKVGTVAGCMVIDGKIQRNNPIRVIRDGIVIYPNREGAVAEIATLKRFKDDVKEVKENMECGISIKNFNDVKVGDIIEAYEITEVKQKLG